MARAVDSFDAAAPARTKLDGTVHLTAPEADRYLKSLEVGVCNFVAAV